MKAIFCYGTRDPESVFVWSLDESNIKALCKEYDVVVNEGHQIDIKERNLTCMWDVYVSNAAVEGLVEKVIHTWTDEVVTKQCHRRKGDTLPFPTELAVFSFRWHGNDDPSCRPPPVMVNALLALERGFEEREFQVVIA